jgi:hypothetical protein
MLHDRISGKYTGTEERMYRSEASRYRVEERGIGVYTPKD